MSPSAAMTSLALLLLPLVVGCGRQNLDLLVSDCTALETEADCLENSELGCTFQPNPTGCSSADPSCGAGVCRAENGFVQTEGRKFQLNGSPFAFQGVSTWAILPAKCLKPDNPDAWLQNAFDELVPSGAKVVRVYAFQDAVGSSGDDFRLLDTTVRMARRAGIRLQLALDHERGSSDCTEGQPRTSAWYSSGYQSLDGAYKLSYREYAETVAKRYRNEPTVLGYVLVQSMYVTGTIDESALLDFVNDVGDLIHSVAPKQLVSLDMSWSVGPTTTFQKVQELPSVDLVNFDDYQREAALTALDENLVMTLDKLNKPAVVGEAAFGLFSTDAAGLQDRANRANSRLDAWREKGIAGALLWPYRPGWTTQGEEFDARPDDLVEPGGVLAKARW